MDRLRRHARLDSSSYLGLLRLLLRKRTSRPRLAPAYNLSIQSDAEERTEEFFPLRFHFKALFEA